MRHGESSPVDRCKWAQERPFIKPITTTTFFFSFYTAFSSKVDSHLLWVSTEHLVFPFIVVFVACESSYHLLKGSFPEEDGQVSVTLGVRDEYCVQFQRLESRNKD